VFYVLHLYDARVYCTISKYLITKHLARHFHSKSNNGQEKYRTRADTSSHEVPRRKYTLAGQTSACLGPRRGPEDLEALRDTGKFTFVSFFVRKLPRRRGLLTHRDDLLSDKTNILKFYNIFITPEGHIII